MEALNIAATTRESVGYKSASKARRQGLVPAVVYHRGEENLHILIKDLALRELIYTPDAHIVNLELGDGVERRAILKSVQYDPITDRPIHLDFVGVVRGELVRMKVPVQVTGSAPGVVAGGLVQIMHHTVEIECIPSKIPDHITVDISGLEINDLIHARDIEIDGVKLLGDPDTPLVGIFPPKTGTDDTEVVAEEAAGEVEVIAKGKTPKA